MQKLALPLSSIVVSVTLLLGLFISPTIKPEELIYGPIQPGDRLWDIALQLRPDPSISRYQVMIAILKANPQAFRIPCNLNSLKIGNQLQIPSLAQMQILTPVQALAEFNRQNTEWQLARQQQQQIVCQPTTNDTPILKASKLEATTSLKPTNHNSTVTKQMTTPVATVTISPAVNSTTDSQWLVITNFLNHWGNQIAAGLVSMTNELNLSWLSTSWLGLLLIGLVISGILIIVSRSQWRRHSLPYHQSVIIKDQNREQLSAEPLLSTLEIQQLHDEVTKSAASPTLQQAPTDALAANTSSANAAVDKIKEKLDNVRSYLAEEEQFIQRTLREVIQAGTSEQQIEAKQLYEISKKINYLKKDKKYLPMASSVDNSSYLQQIEQQLALPKSLPENPEKFFDLIDKIFARLDYELNTPDKLIDAYINRHKSAPVNLETYQVVGKKESPVFNESTAEVSLRQPRPVPKPTRHI